MASLRFVMIIQLVLLVSPMLYGRPHTINITESGDIKIVTEDGKINCDTIECPETSFKCTVLKKTTDDLESVIRTRTCLNAQNESLRQEEVKEKNKYPGTKIYQYSEATTSGHQVSHFSGNLNSSLNVEENMRRANDYANNLAQQIHQKVAQDIQNSFKNAFNRL